MKEKKILCPKCKCADLFALTIVPLFISYDIDRGQVVDDSTHTLIASMSTTFKCKRCQHVWKSKRKLPFSIKVEKEK